MRIDGEHERIVARQRRDLMIEVTCRRDATGGILRDDRGLRFRQIGLES